MKKTKLSTKVLLVTLAFALVIPLLASCDIFDFAKDHIDGDNIYNGKINATVAEVTRDADGDGLEDEDETKYFNTNPNKKDTDNDGVGDGVEVVYGTDPLKAPEASKFAVDIILDTKNDIVKPGIKIDVEASQLNTLTVKENEYFDTDTAGYMGKAYDYSIEGEITSAVVSFEFGTSSSVFTTKATMAKASFAPTIYSFDKEANTLTPLPTTVSGNVASTTVTQFGSFILLDRSVFENQLVWRDVWNVNSKYTDIEIVFLIDDSGSMTSNDSSYKRLTVAKDLIDNLPNGSKIGVAQFDNSTTIHTKQLTTDKSVAKSYLTTSYFASSGSTYMYEAINSTLSLFEAKDDTTMKVMVVLSDGQASTTSAHDSTINAASTAGVKLYTVGLGSSSSSYFTNYLKPLAEGTGGSFYLASNANVLTNIFDDIEAGISLTTDSDGDGLCDYYEDNLIEFDNIKYYSDKNVIDTDGDGILDGDEIKVVYIYNADKSQMTFMGKFYSNPALKDSDGDGADDPDDRAPLNSYVQ